MSLELNNTVMFLEFFFDKARHAMGPADSEIYACIIEEYEQLSGRRVPSVYRDAYITDEEDGS